MPANMIFPSYQERQIELVFYYRTDRDSSQLIKEDPKTGSEPQAVSLRKSHMSTGCQPKHFLPDPSLTLISERADKHI